METPAHSDLAYSLCKYYFDDIVARVVKVLFNHDQVSLRILKLELPDIKIGDLKHALLVLVKYQLVDYVKSVKSFGEYCEYSVVPRRIFSFFRITRFVQEVGAKSEFVDRTILSILMEKALLNREALVDISVKRSNENASEQKLDSLRNEINVHLETLILNHFVAVNNSNLCVNIERLNRNHRDNLIVETLFKYYNQEIKIQQLCRSMLTISFDNTSNDAPVTAPVPLLELTSYLVPHDFKDKAQLERYLTKLSAGSENNFLLPSGVHPVKGSMFAINIGSVLDFLVKEHLSSCVTTRFGPKCCRVFRVLLSRGPLLLKQIEEIIMLPARDVREYAYMLIKEGFIRNRQVPKTPDNAPGKSVFIMSVELDQVVYGTVDLCCRSMNNLLMRYEHELCQNKSLLDKAKAAQKHFQASERAPNPDDDWSQYFNNHELAQLNQINSTLDKILMAKAQVDETLFLLHSWLEVRPNFQQEV